MAYTLPSLPYPTNALEPHIDARTMEIHHGKHHAAYVTNVNKALEGKGLPEQSIEDLCRNIEKVPEEARARLAAADSPLAREAVTRARLLTVVSAATGGPRLVLRLAPLTGRMHQLRLQAAVRGLPIVGDKLYDPVADTAWAGPPGDSFREPPIALHAERIRYLDPDAGGEVVAEAPLPGFWPENAG